MAYIAHTDFSSDSDFTHASPNATISVSGGKYNLVVSSYVDFGNGSYHTAGWTYVAGSIVYLKFRVSNAAAAQTAFKLGQRKNSTLITDEGYDLFFNAGSVGGTSWGASAGFTDRSFSADTDYWLKYEFVSGGDLRAYILGGAFTSWTGIRDMVGASISTGTIRFHFNVAGVSPNDGSGNGFQVDDFIVANASDIDPTIAVFAGANKSVSAVTTSANLSDATASGGDGSFTYAWDVDDGALTFDDDTILNPVASFPANVSSVDKVYTLTLTVNDGLSADVTDQVTITVAGVPNAAPVCNAGPDQTVARTVGATLAGSSTDDGQPDPPATVTYLWAKVSGPGSVTFTDATNPTTHADFGASGTYVLSLTADDSALDDVDTVTIIANDAPVANAGPDQNVTLAAGATLAGSATDDGIPASPGTITYSWAKLSGPGTVNFTSSTNPTTTCSFSVVGTYVLRLTASDSLLTHTDDVTINVNTAPVASAGPDQTVNITVGATLAGSATDDGFPSPPATLTYLWAKVSGPGTVTFTDATNPTTTAQFSASGVYVLSLTASDSHLTNADTVTITANAAPVANAGANQTVTLAAGATLAGSATDDGFPTSPGAISYTWTKVSGPGTVTFTDDTIATTHADFSVVGTYVLSLTASDSLLTHSDTVSILVHDAPIVSAGADQVIAWPDENTFTLEGSALDDDVPDPPGSLTIEWTVISKPDGSTVVFNDASSPTSTGTVSAAGIYVFQLEADDGNASTTDTVTIEFHAIAAYATFQDLQSQFLNLSFTASTGVTRVEVGLFLELDSAIIDSKIASRYSVPVTSGTSSLLILKNIVLMLTKARIKRILARGAGAKQKSQEDEAKALRDEGMALLDEIMIGKMSLIDAQRKTTKANSYGVESDQQPVFKYEDDQW